MTLPAKRTYANSQKKRPLVIASSAIIIGSMAILVAAYLHQIDGETIVGGFGALSQFAIAIFLYFLTKSQLGHSQIEAEYRRKELLAEKASSELEHKRFIFESINTFKTRIGKRGIDCRQVQGLDSLRVQVKIHFKDSSPSFNRAVNAARLAMVLENDAKRDEKLKDFKSEMDESYKTMLSTLNVAITSYNDASQTLQLVYSNHIEPELNIRLPLEEKEPVVSDGPADYE